jgi:hypothetical protein
MIAPARGLMQCAILRQALDRGHFGAVLHDGERRGRANLSRRAVTALERVMVDEWQRNGMIAEGKAKSADEIRELMGSNIWRCGPNPYASINLRVGCWRSQARSSQAAFRCCWIMAGRTIVSHFLG